MGARKKILVIGGDGIGPEVTRWGKEVLQAVAAGYEHDFTFEEALMGHAAIEATGEPLPQATLDKARNADAVLFGAIGHQKYDLDPSLPVRPEQGLLKLRKELGLYTNVRPIRVFNELLFASPLKVDIIRGVDILFFRELTGDVYFGAKTRSDDGNTASDLMVYSRFEVERIAHKAFEAAMARRKKVCSVDKANVLESSRLWRETVQLVSTHYPEVATEHMFVDTAAMQLIREPTRFDVVLTGNLFGDILTDEASQIAGSLGMLASASTGSMAGVFEPIHGSAHELAGKNLANPLASILSASLMLEIAFGLKKEAAAVVSAIERVLRLGFRTNDIADANTEPAKLLRTTEMGSRIAELI